MNNQQYLHTIDLEKAGNTQEALALLLKLAGAGDGHAMRLLALTYMGNWHPILEKSIDKAEELLLKA